LQLRARDELINLHRAENGQDQYDITRQLRVLVKDSRLKDHAKFNFALILAHLNKTDDNAKMILKWYMTNSQYEWRKNQAAVALIQMGEKQVWSDLSEIIGRNNYESFIAAFLLGQLGREELLKLGVRNLKGNNDIASINLPLSALSDASCIII